MPSIGTFFTLLPLRDAFVYQDQVRHISSRRFVAPSFNDVRVILNTAQVMSLSTRMSGALGLVTFDGDVTLYDDGQNLHPDNPVVSRILGLMKKGVRIGIVTAAGYAEPEKYSARLYGLLHAIRDSKELTPEQRRNLIVMGGESSYLCQFDEAAACCLRLLPRGNWVLDEMRSWEREDIEDLLDVAERALRDCVKNMRLDAIVIRKERAVGIVPKEGKRFPREQLEETVLVTQKILEGSRAGKLVPFCAFNGRSRPTAGLGPALTHALQAATTSLLTLATSRGACSRVSATLAASMATRRCTSEISSCRRARTTSRRDSRARRRGSPARRRRSCCWTRSPNMMLRAELSGAALRESRASTSIICVLFDSTINSVSPIRRGSIAHSTSVEALIVPLYGETSAQFLSPTRTLPLSQITCPSQRRTRP